MNSHVRQQGQSRGSANVSESFTCRAAQCEDRMMPTALSDPWHTRQSWWEGHVGTCEGSEWNTDILGKFVTSLGLQLIVLLKILESFVLLRLLLASPFGSFLAFTFAGDTRWQGPEPRQNTVTLQLKSCKCRTTTTRPDMKFSDVAD